MCICACACVQYSIAQRQSREGNYGLLYYTRLQNSPQQTEVVGIFPNREDQSLVP